MGSRRRLSWDLAVVALGLAMAFGWLQCATFHDQINNAIRLKRHARALHAHHEREGAYPVAFGEADHWGAPLFYRSSGDAFVLVSFGRDGQPDTADYESWVGRATHRMARTCGDATLDTVFTDQGAVQACLK